MSDKTTMLGGTPIVKMNDAIDYLLQRTDQPCPACGYTKWDVVAASKQNEDSDIEVGLSIGGVDASSGRAHNSGLPVVAAICKKCSFVRLHAALGISRWMANDRPQFKEGDET